jgi:hypothetical protein
MPLDYLSRNANPVILDFKLELVIHAISADLDVAGFGMPDDIRQRFLDDCQYMGRTLGSQYIGFG